VKRVANRIKTAQTTFATLVGLKMRRFWQRLHTIMNVWIVVWNAENLTSAMRVIINIWHTICVVNAKSRADNLKNAMGVITNIRLRVIISVSVVSRVRHSRLAGIVSKISSPLSISIF